MPETVVYVVIAFTGALLALPVVIRLRVDRPGPGSDVALRAEGSVMAGLFGIAVFGGSGWRWSPTLCMRAIPRLSFALGASSDEPGDQAAAAPQSGESRTADRGGRPWGATLARLNQLRRILVIPAWGLLRSLLRTFDVRALRVDGRVGLVDPAKTGTLFGIAMGLRSAAGARLRIQMQPDFITSGVWGQAHLSVHLFLGLLFGALLRFVVDFASRWLWMTLKTSRMGSVFARP